MQVRESQSSTSITQKVASKDPFSIAPPPKPLTSSITLFHGMATRLVQGAIAVAAWYLRKITQGSSRQPLAFQPSLQTNGSLRCFEEEGNLKTNLSPDVIRVGMVLNQDSLLPTEEQLRSAVTLANNRLNKVTGKGLVLMERCYGRFGKFDKDSPQESLRRTRTMLEEFIARARNLPDYVVVVNTDTISSRFGGRRLVPPYGIRAHEQEIIQQRDPTFCQHISSQVYQNQPLVYGAVIQGIHIYGGCGYSTGPDGEMQITHKTSQKGQCRNQSDLNCVVEEDISLCPNLLDDPRSSVPGAFAHTIAHELIHNFGTSGNGDHHGTAECRGRVDADLLREGAATYLNMCPDVVAELSVATPACLGD